MAAKSSPRLVILNGPTAAGKTTAARALLDKYGASGEFAVLERDVFEDLNGRHQVAESSDAQKRIYKVALPVLIDTARSYLRHGVSVVAVLPFNERAFARLDRAFAKWGPTYVCILPSWAANRARRNKRVRANGPKELQMFDWDSHASFYDELAGMAEDGLFDQVIDSTKLKPTQVADVLAKQLNLSVSKLRSASKIDQR